MSVDGLFSGKKWDILEELSQKAQSPIELARTLNTTVANISMQLRLLEVGHFVQKKRIKNAIAGQPRVVYSLKKEILYVMAATSQTTCKKMFDVTKEQSFMLNLWMLPHKTHGPLMACYVKYPLIFDKDNDVYYSEHGDGVIKIIVSNEKDPLPPKMLNVDFQGQRVGIEVDFITKKQIKKSYMALQKAE